MEYKDAKYSPKKVHSWKPPCSCGVELGEALKIEGDSEMYVKEKVHSWKPPCSCGVSLDEVVE
ncbi:MAG: hypothetical protein M1416_02165 [Candidatus Pacearchaeota archaeon]|nr:hypothetical protein [Candidatus Pacearchaeota archaeon]